jgi:hypothetical protein
VVFLGDVRNGNRLFMDIQSDVKRAKYLDTIFRIKLSYLWYPQCPGA